MENSRTLLRDTDWSKISVKKKKTITVFTQMNYKPLKDVNRMQAMTKLNDYAMMQSFSF